jgi:hypothetical protein
MKMADRDTKDPKVRYYIFTTVKKFVVSAQEFFFDVFVLNLFLLEKISSSAISVMNVTITQSPKLKNQHPKFQDFTAVIVDAP